MKVLSVLLVCALLLPLNVAKYLNDINGFKDDNFFKQEVYKENKWKGFEQLPEVNEKVTTEKYNMHLMNACLFYAANQLRTTKKVPTLTYSEDLRNAALIHSNEMVQRKFYSHINNKNSELRAPDSRLKLVGITNVAMAENIHSFIFEKGTVTYLQLAEEIIKDFYKSEGHRRNLLDKNYTHTGVGALWEYNPKDRYYYLKVTQCFVRDTNL